MNAFANVSVWLFTILLCHISNTFAPVNADTVRQERHCYSSYIIVSRCPWSAVLVIVYLVNYCKITFC